MQHINGLENKSLLSEECCIDFFNEPAVISLCRSIFIYELKLEKKIYGNRFADRVSAFTSAENSFRNNTGMMLSNCIVCIITMSDLRSAITEKPELYSSYHANDFKIKYMQCLWAFLDKMNALPEIISG